MSRSASRRRRRSGFLVAVFVVPATVAATAAHATELLLRGAAHRRPSGSRQRRWSRMWCSSFRRCSWQSRRPRRSPRSCKPALSSLRRACRRIWSKLDPIAGLRLIRESPHLERGARAPRGGGGGLFWRFASSSGTRPTSPQRRERRQRRRRSPDWPRGESRATQRSSGWRSRSIDLVVTQAGVSEQAQDDQGRSETGAPRKRR